MKGERTKAACLASAMAELPEDDSAGWYRGRAVDEARAHYASLPAERLAQLEQEWNQS